MPGFITAHNSVSSESVRCFTLSTKLLKLQFIFGKKKIKNPKPGKLCISCG